MNPVTPEVTTAAGAGTFLSTARLRAGISLNDLASRTRIPRSTLEALEAEDWKSLPAMVYVRGFIRSYARELGMEEAVDGLSLIEWPERLGQYLPSARLEVRLSFEGEGRIARLADLDDWSSRLDGDWRPTHE